MAVGLVLHTFLKCVGGGGSFLVWFGGGGFFWLPFLKVVLDVFRNFYISSHGLGCSTAVSGSVSLHSGCFLSGSLIRIFIVSSMLQ